MPTSPGEIYLTNTLRGYGPQEQSQSSTGTDLVLLLLPQTLSVVPKRIYNLPAGRGLTLLPVGP